MKSSSLENEIARIVEGSRANPDQREHPRLDIASEAIGVDVQESRTLAKVSDKIAKKTIEQVKDDL